MEFLIGLTYGGQLLSMAKRETVDLLTTFALKHPACNVDRFRPLLAAKANLIGAASTRLLLSSEVFISLSLFIDHA
jgi:hypothetical protein